MLVRRAALEQVGFFDTHYRMYYEDADFCVRVQRAGFSLWAEPRAKMWHLVSLSAARQAATTRYQRTRYRVRFYRQHAPRAWVTHLAVCAQELGRMGWALLRGEWDLAGAGWRGLRDGYAESLG